MSRLINRRMMYGARIQVEILKNQFSCHLRYLDEGERPEGNASDHVIRETYETAPGI